ncbi:MAG TPA: homoserine dehydrogenase [Erysipelothrix sp.]|nr:homoserine dehydrogenase [Erysipelothrix sp.]
MEDKRHLLDYEQILKDDEVKIVVEALGGLDPAYTMVKDALRHQKHVVTSNKELVEKYGVELHRTAKEHHVHFLFEASVGGGMPLISTLRHGLYHEEIESIEGILNGTSNYILTKMREDKLSFETALKQAQDLGFAEKDPTDDVEGYDAGRKIAILASILSGHRIDFKDVKIQGISSIDETMIEFANDNNLRIKLIAKVKKQANYLNISVLPTLIDVNHPLYHVEGVNNGVLIKGKDVGDVLIQGAGAGRYPTASAVISDIFALENNDLTRLDWESSLVKIESEKINAFDFKDKTIKSMSELNHTQFLVIESDAL